MRAVTAERGANRTQLGSTVRTDVVSPARVRTISEAGRAAREGAADRAGGAGEGEGEGEGGGRGCECVGFGDSRLGRPRPLPLAGGQGKRGGFVGSPGSPVGQSPGGVGDMDLDLGYKDPDLHRRAKRNFPFSSTKNCRKIEFLGRGLPGVENDPTPCGIILHVFLASKRPYFAKIQIFYDLGVTHHLLFSFKREVPICTSM